MNIYSTMSAVTTNVYGMSSALNASNIIYTNWTALPSSAVTLTGIQIGVPVYLMFGRVIDTSNTHYDPQIYMEGNGGGLCALYIDCWRSSTNSSITGGIGIQFYYGNHLNGGDSSNQYFPASCIKFVDSSPPSPTDTWTLYAKVSGTSVAGQLDNGTFLAWQKGL